MTATKTKVRCDVCKAEAKLPLRGEGTPEWSGDPIEKGKHACSRECALELSERLRPTELKITKVFAVRHQPMGKKPGDLAFIAKDRRSANAFAQKLKKEEDPRWWHLVIEEMDALVQGNQVIVIDATEMGAQPLWK